MGPGHIHWDVGAWVGTLTKHGQEEVLHLVGFVRAVVPHLVPYYLEGAVWRKGLGLLQMCSPAGMAAGRWNSRALPH